jgi:hypothetical protein
MARGKGIPNSPSQIEFVKGQAGRGTGREHQGRGGVRLSSCKFLFSAKPFGSFPSSPDKVTKSRDTLHRRNTNTENFKLKEEAFFSPIRPKPRCGHPS